MNLFEKIMVPLDGSQHSINALRTAIEIAKRFDGKIRLLHVLLPTSLCVPPLQAGAVNPQVTILQPYLDGARKSGEEILADGKRAVENEGIMVDAILREGNLVREISKMSREGDFDLIVIGTRGHSEIREILRGSVSNGVVHHVACPVLLVR